MKNTERETPVQDHAHKPRRLKSREVSSRFLSSPGSTQKHDSGIPSPNHASSSSPIHKKAIGRSSDSKRAINGFEDSAPPRGLLWPSATNKKLDTLADHLGDERLKDLLERKHKDEDVGSHTALFMNRQRSCSEISRFESESQRGITNSSSLHGRNLKENHRPSLGGSMRYAGKLSFLGRKSSAAALNSSTFESPKVMLPGRLSVDENALYKSSSHRKPEPDHFRDVLDSESESSEVSSSCASNLSCTSRKSGREVPSRYMNNLTARPKGGNLESNIANFEPLDHESEKSKKFMIKGVIKRAGSLTGYGSSKSQWAMSPGRTGSPTMSIENKNRPTSSLSMKPPSSPSRSKGVEKLLNMGLDLFKAKKSSSPSNMSPGRYSSGGGGEDLHELRLLHNRLMQWRFANARSDMASQNLTDNVQRSLLNACASLEKSRHSIVLKKLQLEKERLEMKLNCFLRSQMKLLYDWEGIERQHSSAVSNTTESLLSIVCRVQLKDGAEADSTSMSYALRHASDLTKSIESLLSSMTPSAESTAPLLSELAEVVAQERLLLEECLEHLRIMSLLEIEESNSACAILQLSSCQ